MNDYDKAFAVIRDRFYKQSDMTDKTILGFSLDYYYNILAQFNDGFLRIYDDIWCPVTMSSHHEKLTILPTTPTIKHLIKVSQDHDIYIGFNRAIKVLSKGETLESLAIEYDMSLKNLDI